MKRILYILVITTLSSCLPKTKQGKEILQNIQKDVEGCYVVDSDSLEFCGAHMHPDYIKKRTGLKSKELLKECEFVIIEWNSNHPSISQFDCSDLGFQQIYFEKLKFSKGDTVKFQRVMCSENFSSKYCSIRVFE